MPDPCGPRVDPGITVVILTTMKTAISIPDDLFAEAEGVAERLGLSRSEMFARAVRAFVKRNRDMGVTERLNEVYAKEASELDPAVAAMQDSSVPREEW